MNETKRDKLFRVLGALIDPEIGISNDCYLEMLITHLAGKCKSPGEYHIISTTSYPSHQSSNPFPDKEARDVLKTPKILEWIEAAVSNWEQNKCPEPHVIAFIIRLTGLVIENEWQFSLVKEKQILERFVNRLESNQRLD